MSFVFLFVSMFYYLALVQSISEFSSVILVFIYLCLTDFLISVFLFLLLLPTFCLAVVFLYFSVFDVLISLSISFTLVKAKCEECWKFCFVLDKSFNNENKIKSHTVDYEPRKSIEP